MKHFVLLLLLTISLITLVGCGSETKTLVPKEEFELGYLEDNVVVIHPKKYDLNYVSQAISTTVEELHIQNKVVTGIFSLNAPDTNKDSTSIIYIIYTDNPSATIIDNNGETTRMYYEGYINFTVNPEGNAVTISLDNPDSLKYEGAK
jgi:hypothetical protein